MSDVAVPAIITLVALFASVLGAAGFGGRRDDGKKPPAATLAGRIIGRSPPR